MTVAIELEIPMPGNLRRFQLPCGVQRRLTELLDRQDSGQALSLAERREAEGLVEMAEVLTLLKMQSARKLKARA